MSLFLHDLQYIHGAGLDTNAASDTLGGVALGGLDHDLHGADFDTLAAAGALLLVDYVHTGLGVLGNGLELTNLRALAALDAGHRLGAGTLSDDLNAGLVGIELFIKSIGAGTNALKTCHTLGAFFHSESFHS